MTTDLKIFLDFLTYHSIGGYVVSKKSCKLLLFVCVKKRQKYLNYDLTKDKNVRNVCDTISSELSIVQYLPGDGHVTFDYKNYIKFCLIM